MAAHTGSELATHVTVTLYNDQIDEEASIPVSRELAELFAYADAWARQENRHDDATLTFSSTLAAMVAGNHPLSDWLRRHLALRGSSASAVTKERVFPELRLPAGRLTTTHSFRRALDVDEQQKARIGGEECASGPNIFTGCAAEKLPVRRLLA